MSDFGNIVTNQTVHYMSAKECEFSIDGDNLAAIRRARLRTIAKALKVSPDGSKQEILKRVIGRLKSSGAPKELKDLTDAA